MTTVKYDRDDLSVEITGHSGYAERDKDIVCSAISILCFALASYAVKVNDRGMLTRNPRIRLDDGDMEVSLSAIGLYKRQIRTTFDSICSSFEWLSEHYPENVKYEVIYEGI